MEIKLPTAQQVDNIMTSYQLPDNNLKLVSRNKDKSLLWYDTERKIVYGVRTDVPFLERNELFASYDYGMSWIKVHTAMGAITVMRTLKSGYHLIRDSATSKVRRVSPDFSKGTYPDIIMMQPVNTDNGIAQNPDGIIVYAEYSAEGKETLLYRSVDDGITWSIARRGTDIRHWHSVQCDPYTGYFWACSGDSGMQNRIVVSTDGGVTWQTKTEGTQADRAVGLAFTRDFIYWGMDDTGSPKIYKANKNNFTKIELAAVPGGSSVLGVAKAVDGSIIFWTRTEPTNIEQKDYANFFIMSNDKIKFIQNFDVQPNLYGGFTWGSSVDENNRWFVYGSNTVMSGLLGFTLPLVSNQP